MNLYRIFSFPVFLMMTALVYAGNITFPFKTDSRLSSGKWIKVEIDKTGLYQIDYDMLREMGFENPERVGVYGRGGELLSTNFVTANDYEPYSDDLSPVSVIHENNSLYFYGKNTERVTFTPGAAPKFNRGLGNLYSTTSYYFLSDSDDPVIAEVYNAGDSAEELTSGWDYVYHELDLTQNTSGTGQVFWGEDFLDGNPEKSWNITMPYNTGTARVAFRFYTSADTIGSTAYVKLGESNDEKAYNCKTSSTVEAFYAVPSEVVTTPAEFTLDGNELQTLTIRADVNDQDFHNLDYWMVTYGKKIPEGSSISSNPAERYTFCTYSGKYYSIPLDPSLRLIDITDPSDIKKGFVDESNPGNVIFNASDDFASVVVYDPAQHQLNIKEWKTVENINLHGLQQNVVDLLIVTTPELREYAECLASLHKSYQGIDVAVVTPEEIYNEFSAGVPDPMAYRAISRMLYQSDSDKYRNMLLFGPSDRNLRQEIEGETKFDRIIAYQQISVTPARDASPVYDFYGVLDDDINETTLYAEEMQVGVGLLSCENSVDCERILCKIERYLADDTQAWRVNETMTIGDIGDSHSHDAQAEEFGNEIRTFSGVTGMSHTTVAIDAYGNEDARRQVIKNLETGKNFSVYFGHGSQAMFGQDKNFFTTAEAVNLRNSHCGFMFMGGCDFSVPDIRSRGLGESFLLDTDHGMIGTILSTRTAWSNQNYSLGRKFLYAWLNYPLTETSPTIGEIYARAKSGKNGVGSNVMNSLTFVLAGDPALKVPTPIRTVSIEAPQTVVPGQKVIISGEVQYKKSGSDASGIDNGFNGKAVLKLMQPPVVLRSKDYVTNTCNTEKNENGDYITLDVTYDAVRMVAVETEVKDGKFTAEIIIPASATDFTGDNLTLKAGAFDKSTWLGGAGEVTIQVGETEEVTDDMDTEAPVLDMFYDSSRQVVVLSAYDDNAMLLSASNHSAVLDAKPYTIYDEQFYETGETGRQFSACADVCNLQDGEHEISATVTDVAGNSVTEVLEFEKTPVVAPLVLTLSSKAVVDGLEVNVEGEYSGELDYEVVDTNGNTVMKLTEGASTITWNCMGNDGKRVPEGLYRVRVRSAAEVGRTLFSDWVNFAVFD